MKHLSLAAGYKKLLAAIWLLAVTVSSSPAQHSQAAWTPEELARSIKERLRLHYRLDGEWLYCSFEPDSSGKAPWVYAYDGNRGCLVFRCKDRHEQAGADTLGDISCKDTALFASIVAACKLIPKYGNIFLNTQALKILHTVQQNIPAKSLSLQVRTADAIMSCSMAGVLCNTETWWRIKLDSLQLQAMLDRDSRVDTLLLRHSINQMYRLVPEDSAGLGSYQKQLAAIDWEISRLWRESRALWNNPPVSHDLMPAYLSKKQQLEDSITKFELWKSAVYRKNKKLSAIDWVLNPSTSNRPEYKVGLEEANRRFCRTQYEKWKGYEDNQLSEFAIRIIGRDSLWRFEPRIAQLWEVSGNKQKYAYNSTIYRTLMKLNRPKYIPYMRQVIAKQMAAADSVCRRASLQQSKLSADDDERIIKWLFRWSKEYADEELAWQLAELFKSTEVFAYTYQYQSFFSDDGSEMLPGIYGQETLASLTAKMMFESLFKKSAPEHLKKYYGSYSAQHTQVSPEPLYNWMLKNKGKLPMD